MKYLTENLQRNGHEVYKSFFRSSRTVPSYMWIVKKREKQNVSLRRGQNGINHGISHQDHVRLQEQLKKKQEHGAEGDGKRTSKCQSMGPSNSES